MSEQFIPRKERHRRKFLKDRVQNEEQSKMIVSTYLKCFIYYFFLFSIFGLVHIYVDQVMFQKSIQLLTDLEMVRLILISVIYFICYICIIDTFIRFKFTSTFIRYFLAALAFIFSIISNITLIGPFI